MNTHPLIRTLGPSLKLTRSQIERFSITELIGACVNEDAAVTARYRAISDDLQEACGRITSTHRSFYLPPEVITRDMTVGAGGSSGGYLVNTDRLFGTSLFAASVFGRLPMVPLTLKGNATVTNALSVETAWQAGEATEITHADPAFGQGALAPKTAAAVTKVSRTLSVQLGVDGEAFVQGVLGRKLGEAVDYALLQGSGSAGSPLGVLNTPDVASVSGTNLAWSGVVDMIGTAEGYGVDGLAFACGVSAAKLLRKRERAAGSGVILDGGKIDNIPVYVTRAMPTDALVLAPWDSVAMASWSPVEVTITPLSSRTDFISGKVGVRLLWTIDFLAMNPTAISKSTSIT